MDKKEFRVLIKHCFLMEKNTVEAKQLLDKRYGDSAPGKSTIIDWYTEFKLGSTNTDDAECSGHPKSSVIPENIAKVHKIVLRDRKLKLRQIADTLKISEGSVFTIFTHPTKNNNRTRIQSVLWSRSRRVKRIFCVNM